MALRTNFKDVNYFDNYINNQLRRISTFEQIINSEKNDFEKIDRLNYVIATISQQILIAMYSRGDSITDIKEYFNTVVNKFEKGFNDSSKTPMDKYNFDNYIKIIWLLSWCILLNVREEIYNKIISKIEITNRNDFFINLFISYLTKEIRQNDTLYYEEPFYKLKNILTQNTEADKSDLGLKLFKFLQKDYYKGMKLAYWYDDHKNKYDVFFGYWSWEVAAISKIFNVKDDMMRKSSYYPFDMVNYVFEK